MFNFNIKIKRSVLIFLLLLIGISLAYTAQAQLDPGLSVIDENIALSAEDPRAVVARIINITMLLLGVIALGLIIWGGFIWMTSNGAEEKIEQAKKILKNGIIGLLIILSAWGIATFILNRLISATGSGGGSGSTCTTGQVLSCGCGGSMTCTEGSWGPCLGSDCGGGTGPQYCDSSPLAGCQAADQMCAEDSYCNTGSCECVPKGNLGDACNADPSGQTCSADDNLCAEYLSCSTETCTCYGPPVITGISPMGGFCEEDENKSCLNNDDCVTTCNTEIPNGAVNNFITISGTNFGNYDPQNSKVLFANNTTGVEPVNINPNCINSWTNNQIIVAVPSGAISGALSVVTVDNNTDTSNDDNGPILPDFLVNDIVRPGLCLMNPNVGALSQQVNYQGFNLYSAEAYFGNYQSNVRGLDSIFIDPAGLDGVTTVPNVRQGKTSSFVLATINGNQEKSNYVTFDKEVDPNAGPYISYFSPSVGRAGQYVTIYGSGFGGARGFSRVFFGEVEAEYEFPAVCSDSVWQDRQIIVKVPAALDNGYYPIKVELTTGEINSQNANPNVFQVDTEASLKTSICRISPSRGPVSSPVSVWGEYFGEINGSALLVFTPNKNNTETIVSDGSAQKIDSSVPVGASSGPVRVVKNGEWGNVVNFEVGICQSDNECGADICCPAGTYKQNQCVASLAECYITIPNSIFEWDFATGFGGVSTSTPYDSCEGMAQALGACQVGAFCPNSAGLCSPFSGGLQNVGTCDASCESVAACAGNPQACTYDSERDVCVLNNNTCSLDSILNYDLNGVAFSAPQTCKVFSEYNNQSHWEIKVPTSCPSGWTRLSNNRCVSSTSATESSCSLCDDGLNCIANMDVFESEMNNDTQGVCASANLCPSGASCQNNICMSEESSRCDCCCEIGQDARDCCAPLVCSGTCGSDTSEDNSGLGQCSGCAIPASGGGFDVAASDQACNCAISSGKYCDTSVPTGVCTDCSSLSRESCLDHSQVCCLDSKGTDTITDDVCVGGSGEDISSDPSSPDFGYCAYYNCQDENGDPSLCAADNPLKIGLFKDISTCDANCEINPGVSFCSQHDGDYSSCSMAADCCYNYSDGTCIGGDSISPIDGYCAYYNCQAAPNETQCNQTPSMVGDYNTISACVYACANSSPSGAGQDCRDLTAIDTCNTSFCSSPFACLNEAGAGGIPGDCGTCCCQVNNPESCAGLGSGDLVCQPNQTPCSGENRGLCCGCSEDLDCGDAVNVGCDSGTCCRARPNIMTDNLVPAHGADNVCRNAAISIPFDQRMDVASLMNNIILLEEKDYGTGVCPSGTFVASLDSSQANNWFKRTINRVLAVVNSVFRKNTFSSSALAHALPSNTKLYCAVPGSVSIQHDGVGTTAEFKPKKMLSAGTKYYLVVKGDETLNSDVGVLSQWMVGMNGQGYLDLNNGLYVEGENITFNNLSFHNSYISSFATLSDQGTNSGVCSVEYVSVAPNSYLFQSTNDDINENDDDVNDSSFDSVSDQDKLFNARAYSADNQLLTPTSGYYWDWDWDLMNNGVAFLADPANLADHQAFVVANQNVVDDSTMMTTAINMDRFSGNSCNSSPTCVCTEPNCLNNCCNAYTDGDGVQTEVPLFVFICQNPWPAVNPGTLNWSPWYDTCEGATGNCANYNYKFYYCRDAGVDGLADDLPAMIDPGLILGANESLVCSEGQSTCSTLGASCGPDRNSDGIGDGFCVWNVLKESYFFKEAAPSVGAITAAIDLADGNSARIEWYGDASLIYNADPNQLGKYRVYYAPENSGTWNFIDVKPTASFEYNDVVTPACTPLSPSAGQNYSCQKVITGLNNNTNYKVKVSAISINQVESALSNEKTVIISDSQAPTIPQNLSALIVNGQRLRFTWQANNDDTLFYRLYHGVNAGQYGQSFDSDNQATSLELDLRQFPAGANYFALTALDASGNESFKSAPTYIVLNVQ